MGTAQSGELPATRRHSPKRGRHSGAPTLRKQLAPVSPKGPGCVCRVAVSPTDMAAWGLGECWQDAWAGPGE